MHKGKGIIYIDSFGKENDALVTAINPLHPDFVSLAYVDLKAAERDNVVHVYDVAHMDHESRADVREVKATNPRFGDMTVVDGNPDLPHYDTHVWKERDEEHNALPADHPTFDHPFAQPQKDQDGKVIVKPRPEFEAEIKEHLAAKEPAKEPSEADLDAVAEEEKIKAQTKGKPRIVKGSK